MKLAIVALLVAALPARADDEHVELVRMRFVERGDDLTVTTKLTGLFDEAAYQALNSGFPSTVVINAFVYAQDDRQPINAVPLVRTVVYDLWDEQYVIKLEEPGASKKPIKVKYQSEALKILTSIDDLTIAKLADIPYEDIFYLRLTVELNPVDKQTLTEVRRWLSQSTGGGLDRGGTFFGSFVSVFVNPKIADADRVLKIRSQPFYRPKP